MGGGNEVEDTFQKISRQNALHFVAVILYLIFVYFCAPICFAFFLSSIFVPILKAIEKKTRLHYYVLIVLSSLTFLAFFSGIVFLFIEHGDSFLYGSYNALRQFFSTLEEIPILSYAIAPLQQAAIELLSKAASILQLLIHYIFDVLLFIIAFYFSLFEGRSNRYWYFVYVPKKYRHVWQQFFHEAIGMFLRYFTIEIRLMMITAIILSIGFSLLQFSNPIAKGILLALLDCIPFFGISLVIIPCLVYFVLIHSYNTAIGLIILLIITIVIRQLFDTYLWASFVKIKTIHTFFISGVSFMIFGIYGIIVSPIVLLAVMKLRIYYERR